MLVAGGVRATMPIALVLQARVGERLDAVEARARLEDQRIGGLVIGVGVLHQLVALRVAHDHVAFVRAERVAHEADDLREVGVGHGLAELARRSSSASFCS